MNETLQMIFGNTDGRNTTVSVAAPQAGLDAPQVEAVMDLIVDRDIFTTSSGGSFERKVRSQVVSRSVTILGEY